MSISNDLKTVVYSLSTTALLVFNIGCTHAGSAIFNGSEGMVTASPNPVAGRNLRRNLKRPIGRAYPQAGSDSVRVVLGANKVRINVLANDQGRDLKLSGVNHRSAKGGRLYLQASRVIYLPPLDYAGVDSFWYTVVDMAGRKHSAKVLVCVCDK